MRRSLIASALVAGTLLVPVSAAGASTDIVISEFRVRGPSGGNDEFIELRNTASTPVPIGGWQLRGSNSSGGTSVRATIDSGVTLQPGGVYLLTNSGSNGYSGSVEGDQTYSVGITDDGGIGLFRPNGSSADEVGMSLGAAFHEATPLAPLGTANLDRSYERRNNGIQDTDVNANDFVLRIPSEPQNNGGGSQEEVLTGLQIAAIQGAGHVSPVDGKLVGAVEGVVTAVSVNGFWMQDPTPDADPETSEGIFVFLRNSGRTAGQAVKVGGRVTEFRPGNDANNLTTTEIAASDVVVTGAGDIEPALIGPGGLTPPTEVIEDDATGDAETTGEFDPAQDGLDFHESLEGMLVSVAKPRATGPTNGFGEVSVVPEGFGGPFTPRGGIYITAEDFNPERLILDDVIADTPDVNTGDGLGPVEAVVDYSFGNFKYLVTGTPARIDNRLQQEVTEEPRANQLAIASLNVENLDARDPQDKFDELASIVVENLRSPDILAVEEIQDDDGPATAAPTTATLTYDKFIAAIAKARGPSYEFRQIDPNSNADGGERNGNIRVGFLFRTDRGLEFVDRPGAGANTPNSVVETRKGARLAYSPGRIDPANPAFASSRKPLAAEFEWRDRTVFAIANHFNSKSGDQPLFGRNQPPQRSSEVQRHQQAEIVRSFVEDILAIDTRAAVAVMGDFNDFQFSETLGILEGAGLVNLVKTLPAEEQYSYVFDGNSQVLDQILVSQELLTPEPEYDSVHVNAEFADQASDHDPQVARVVVRGTGNANGQ